MTACNDSQVTLGKKVVGTALAGTLAVGMVPAVALAAPADDTAADDGIETLTADVVTEFTNATISQVSINGATAAATPTDKIEIAKGTEGADVLPAQLTSSITGNTLSILDKNGELIDGLELNYAVASGATGTVTNAGEMPTAIGTYTVQIVGAASGDYKGLKSATLTFSIVGKSLQGATLYEVVPNEKGDDSGNVSDTTFTYNGLKQKIGVALNGVALDSATDYSVKYYEKDGITPVVDGSKKNVAPTNAGEYVAVVEGDGDYLNSEAQIRFTVNKLDLSTAAITVNDVQLGTQTATGATNGTSLEAVNGSTEAAAAIDASGFLSYGYTVVPTKTGSFAVTIAPQDTKEAASNITGSKTLNYNVVDSVGIYATYGAPTKDDTGAITKLAPQLQSDTYDLSKGQSFSVSAITVYPGTTTQPTDLTNLTTLPASQYEVVVTDQDGNTVPTSSLSTPGIWNVTVAVKSEATGYKYGGKQTVKVTVVKGAIEGGDIFVTYKGVAKSSFDKFYTGKNYLSDVAVKVVVDGVTLTEGTDYEVAYTNSKGDAVTEFTNADTYNVTVTSKTWQIVTGANAANVCEFEVAPIPLNAADLKVANTVTIDGSTGIAYTGEELTPAFKYATIDEDGKPVLKNKKPVMATLPATAYKITKITDKNGDAVKAIVDTGDYTVTLADNADDKNFAITSGDVAVPVINDTIFLDVPANAWFAESVDKAYTNRYMNGYAGTKLFGPNDKITRADVACVLFNMAGGQFTSTSNNGYSEISGWKTGFSDVDGHMYYAQAIAWAKQTGVVNGYKGTDKFGPNDFVTREQFAAMLANYAKASGKDIAVEDAAAVLASKPDGAKVSGWAKESVAWAVSNKYMGNGGTIAPLSSITRAEVAAMAVNYQPKPLTSSSSTDKPDAPADKPDTPAATVSTIEPAASTLAVTVGTPADAPTATVTMSDKSTSSDAYTVELKNVNPANCITYNPTTGKVEATGAGSADLVYTAKGDSTKTATVTVTATN